jgi:hypothetical protein
MECVNLRSGIWSHALQLNLVVVLLLVCLLVVLPQRRADQFSKRYEYQVRARSARTARPSDQAALAERSQRTSFRCGVAGHSSALCAAGGERSASQHTLSHLSNGEQWCRVYQSAAHSSLSEFACGSGSQVLLERSVGVMSMADVSVIVDV